MNIELRIHNAIKQRAGEIREEIIEAAVADFRYKITNLILNVAIDVSKYYSIQTMGGEVIMTVRMQGLESKGEGK